MVARLRLAAIVLGFCAAAPLRAADAPPVYSFGVVAQRSAVLTAQYWNPIIDYVVHRAHVGLTLKLVRTTEESSDATARGNYDFVYSNHIFKPRAAAANYRVILCPEEGAITGQIVTQPDAQIRSVKDLAGMQVGFPSPAAFIAYAVPMAFLMRQGIAVTPVFGGNEEGIMAQLQAGKVKAAAVNSRMLRDYAKREKLHYRVIWESGPFRNIPVAAHPRVPPTVVAAVQQAFAAMAHDPEGFGILEASARLVGQEPPYGFRAAAAADYRSYVDFYRATPLKDGR